MAGAAAASLESCDEASSGKGASTVTAAAASAAAASAFSRFRRRWGASSIEDGAVCRTSPDGSLAATRDSIPNSLPLLLLLLLWKVFAQKNRLSTSSSLAAAICRVLVAHEKVRRAGCARAIVLTHRRQIDPVSNEDGHAVRAGRMCIGLGKALQY